MVLLTINQRLYRCWISDLDFGFSGPHIDMHSPIVSVLGPFI